MLVFLDETFRTNQHTGRSFGALGGIAIPEELFHAFQSDVWQCRIPYHRQGILREDAELHGTKLLNKTTRKRKEQEGFSYHWNLAEEVISLARSRRLRVFGVVCFRTGLHSFVCGDEHNLDLTYRYLFERIDSYMKKEFPQRKAKIIFDNRDHRTDERNARAMTNFFMRSSLGNSYDSIIHVPLFAVSQGHNYGLQVADLVTTVVGLRFQGQSWIRPLWEMVKQMLYVTKMGELKITSLKVLRNR